VNTDLLQALIPVVREAGALIEGVRRAGHTARWKSDKSPVTEADERAEALIIAAIETLDPGTLIVGEEHCNKFGKPTAHRRFWLIDPLDGTRSFLDGGSDYSVNVALIEDGRPVLGLVQAPRTDTIWGGADDTGAWRMDGSGAPRPIRSRPLSPEPVVVVSRSHRDSRTDAYVAAIPDAAVKPSGSSLKFCMLAEGEADIYPRFGPTSEWDTAAAHAVLLAAGGAMYGPDGEAFSYGKADYLNGPFLAVGDPAAYAALPALV
jgi:3'(2'), 5'-bisphosphate nucleotidase